MKRIYQFYLSVIFIVQANVVLAQIHATSESNGSNIECTGCSVKNGSDAIDGDYLTTYSSIKQPSNKVGSFVFQQFKFSKPSMSTANFQMTVQNDKLPLNVAQLAGISITSLYNGISNNDTKNINNIILQAVSGSSTLYRISLQLNANFDEVQVKLLGGITGTLSELNIYEVFYNPIIALPVNLISFSGINQNGTNQLNWSTSSESNNSFFTIERSLDALNFNSIATIKSEGNASAVSNYIYADQQPSLGVNYYRLKQTDYNGKETILEMISIKESTNDISELTIASNPFQESVGIYFQSSKSGMVEIQIIDREGKHLYASYNECSIGNNRYTFSNLENLGDGVYTLMLKSETTLLVQKIIKL